VKVQNIKYLSFPVPAEFHKQLKTLALLKGITYKALVLRLTQDYVQREENQTILAKLK
jgi:hypothetical protein